MQKEQLSALMDGEILDQSLLSSLAKDPELQQSWTSYHLIRDTLRGDVGTVVHFDISARVAEAIAQEPARNVTPFIPEAQPEPSRWSKMPFFGKKRPWAAQLAQVGVAACVSLAVIVGVQHYGNSPTGSGNVADTSDTPAFNTLPMMGKASPVSLGVPSDIFDAGNATQQVQEQRRRVNAMLQDYELQRRLNNDQFESGVPEQAQINVPGNQSLGIQQQ
ncbi:anti-sigma-E factor RseA [Tatumella citrea]|uniref:Anti-sigma-E factor RseA n=1 Tax=Tatumella citrea TaxID=53336 RepID=A0A1Y0LB15_TATCI|nr:anti-sigma-E factor RseA [Tatumella citrea]ARU94955.1 anti-sigma factor [Tatumella citrea]ARU98993.1 anti-sigma factor [Tatumella citrea]